jgi:signal transduction histidine kinase
MSGTNTNRLSDNVTFAPRPKKPAAVLWRTTFTTSRLIEFCGRKELVAQTGHDEKDWPSVIVKELIDNALDIAEEAEVAPVIDVSVSTERGEIIVTDNGSGLPPAQGIVTEN